MTKIEVENLVTHSLIKRSNFSKSFSLTVLTEFKGQWGQGSFKTATAKRAPIGSENATVATKLLEPQ